MTTNEFDIQKYFAEAREQLRNRKIEFYKARGPNGFLSNLYPAEIEFEGKKFATSEHAYQYGKFVDKEIADWVMTAPKTHLVCIIAHGLFKWDIVPNWTLIKESRMKAVLKAKFTQHLELKEKLLATENKTLIEVSNTDSFWGIGKNKKGRNMLGQMLMELRNEFKESTIPKCDSDKDCSKYNDGVCF